MAFLEGVTGVVTKQAKRMGKKKRQRKGRSYAKRVADINEIYDDRVKTGLSNREIWKRWIYPRYGISERTFYNLLKSAGRVELASKEELIEEGLEMPSLFSEDELRDWEYYKKNP